MIPTKKNFPLLVLFLLLLAVPITVVALWSRQDIRQRAATAVNTNVDFNTKLVDIAPFAFSSTISTYGTTGNITKSQKQRDALKNLGLGLYRIPLRWNNGAIASSANGASADISGDTWIANIRAFGAEPMIVIGGTTLESGSRDNTYTPSDAANLVEHFNGHGGTKTTKITYWVIGNEPDNQSHPMSATCALFNQTYDAMKTVDPNIKIAGPALASYEVGSNKASEYKQFLQCSGSRVDIVDFHAYGGDPEAYTAKINDIRSSINQFVPTRASQIAIQVGEYNIAPFANGNTDPQFYNGHATVWGALAAGSIAKAGARGHQYSDQNNPLGLTFEDPTVAATFGKTVNDPLPIYHSLGMFTGETLFRKFGTQMVQATTTLPNVSLFASTNEKNIVMVNKDATITQTASVQLTGFSGGTMDVWQTNKDKPFDPPVKKASVTIGSGFEFALPPYSVTTFVLNATSGSTQATATPLPTVTPTKIPAPTSAAKITQVNLTLLLHGLGKGGDNANASSVGNMTPLHTQRTVTIEFYNSTNQLVASKQTTVSFNTTAGNFTGSIDIGTTIPNGIYLIKVKTPQYLRTSVPGIYTITNGTPLQLTTTTLATGDSNGDNTLDISDYSMLLDCYSDFAPAKNCTPENKQVTDLNDDGEVNSFDYNIFLRELSNRTGQ